MTSFVPYIYILALYTRPYSMCESAVMVCGSFKFVFIKMSFSCDASLPMLLKHCLLRYAAPCRAKLYKNIHRKSVKGHDGTVYETNEGFSF